MKKNIIILILLAVLVLIMSAVVSRVQSPSSLPGISDDVVACTMDAKICPDGSAVGRIGPDCEFAACPGEGSSSVGDSDISSELIDGVSLESKSQGLVTGVVTTSPHCGAQRIPPDPNCGPRPYATEVIAILAGTNDVAATEYSNSEGEFTFNLPVGDFVIRAKGGEVYPRCTDATVQVIVGESITQDIHCDTGIR